MDSLKEALRFSITVALIIVIVLSSAIGTVWFWKEVVGWTP